MHVATNSTLYVSFGTTSAFLSGVPEADILSRSWYSYSQSPYIFSGIARHRGIPPQFGAKPTKLGEPEGGQGGGSQLKVPSGGNRAIAANYSYSIANHRLMSH